ncbi:UDP-glucuronosyltransferase 2C1 [Cephus cinctus]|uniref:UDP-glucuronosyltransferase 2C1 n=1 Tax=Cephus cinctus TaxID=211228 RepID=A0AAJ7FUD8_CEPCN|nr:UDP-glucuronosyltransferase 2C1 [Cephus cinctus]
MTILKTYVYVVLMCLLGIGYASIPLPDKKFKILGVFGHVGKSHFAVFEPLLEELALRGHDVTVLSHFPRTTKLKNYKDLSLRSNESQIAVDVVDLKIVKAHAASVLFELVTLYQWGLAGCEINLKHPNTQKLIKSNEKFDVILTEVFNSDCFLGFVHKFQAPFLSLSSHQILPWVNPRIGNPDNPSYISTTFHGYSSHMTFYERLMNTIFLGLEKIMFYTMFTWSTDVIVREVFGPEVPSVVEIGKNMSALLVNTHYSLHRALPQVPGTIEIGGIHIGTPKPLPADIKKFLDEGTEGVLLFSWGSMVKASTLPQEKLNDIIKVISNIPRRVIWKWEADELPGKPKNLMIKKWLPQADILGHPNVKCYLAHGGLLGLSEGVNAGVPLVLVPMYGDQFHNAAQAKSRGVAEIVEYENLNEKTLREALDKIFNDTRYLKNARLLAKAYKDRPAGPLDTAVWWTEYIARGDGVPFIRSPAVDLPWYQYHLVDVYVFLISAILVSIYVAIRFTKMAVSAAFGNSKAAKSKQSNDSSAANSRKKKN